MKLKTCKDKIFKAVKSFNKDDFEESPDRRMTNSLNEDVNNQTEKEKELSPLEVFQMELEKEARENECICANQSDLGKIHDCPCKRQDRQEIKKISSIYISNSSTNNSSSLRASISHVSSGNERHSISKNTKVISTTPIYTDTDRFCRGHPSPTINCSNKEEEEKVEAASNVGGYAHPWDVWLPSKNEIKNVKALSNRDSIAAAERWSPGASRFFKGRTSLPEKRPGSLTPRKSLEQHATYGAKVIKRSNTLADTPPKHHTPDKKNLATDAKVLLSIMPEICTSQQSSSKNSSYTSNNSSNDERHPKMIAFKNWLYPFALDSNSKHAITPGRSSVDVWKNNGKTRESSSGDSKSKPSKSLDICSHNKVGGGVGTTKSSRNSAEGAADHIRKTPIPELVSQSGFTPFMPFQGFEAYATKPRRHEKKEDIIQSIEPSKVTFSVEWSSLEAIAETQTTKPKYKRKNNTTLSSFFRKFI